MTLVRYGPSPNGSETTRAVIETRPRESPTLTTVPQSTVITSAAATAAPEAAAPSSQAAAAVVSNLPEPTPRPNTRTVTEGKRRYLNTDV